MAYYYSSFRKEYAQNLENYQEKEQCPFCFIDYPAQVIQNEKSVFIEDEHYFWILNWFPRFEGHTMIVPKRHLVSLADEKPEEVLSRQKMIIFAMRQLEKVYPNCGFEVFLQYGESSQQSIKHIHWHIVPAQKDDPLRGFQKMGHFNTDEAGKEKEVIFPVPIKLARADLLAALKKAIGTETFNPEKVS